MAEWMTRKTSRRPIEALEQTREENRKNAHHKTTRKDIPVCTRRWHSSLYGRNKEMALKMLLTLLVRGGWNPPPQTDIAYYAHFCIGNLLARALAFRDLEQVAIILIIHLSLFLLSSSFLLFYQKGGC